MVLIGAFSIDATNLTPTRVLLAAIAFVSFLGILRIFYALFISPHKDIPGPLLARFTRLWELRQMIRGDSHETIVNLHKEHGPIVRLAPNRYSFNTLEAQKKIYAHGGDFNKTNYYNAAEDPERPNLFSLKDETIHADRRKKLSNLYSMSSLVSYEDAVDRMNAVCIRKFKEMSERGKQVLIPEFMQCYAFDVIGEITLDKNFGMMEKEGDVDGLIELVHMLIRYQGVVGIMPEFHLPIFRIGNMLGSKSANTMEQIAKSQMDKHRGSVIEKENPRRDPFVTKLLRLESAGKVEYEHMLDSMASNIAAGSDTTAITLSAALYYLYRNHRILEALRKEIDDFAADGKISDPVSFKEAQSMPYLQAVIMETLRLHSAVGYIYPRRVPKGGVDLSGRFFPEGTEVGVSAWALHRNPDVYGEDAEDFRPERFLNSDSKNTAAQLGGSFAFGAGARTCIGKNISLLEMCKVLPQIARQFDLVFVDDKPWELFTTWFVWQKYYCYIEPRNISLQENKMVQSDEDARQLYNDMGKSYEDAYGENPNQTKFVRQSLNRLSISSSTAILDIGQGTGKPTSAMIAQTGCKLYGIDVSEGMTKIARKQVPEGDFTTVSMLEYKPPFQFDAAFAIFSTFGMKLEEVEQIVPKWGEWIKPSGWLFVGTIAGEDWGQENVHFEPFKDVKTGAGIAEPRHMGQRVKTLNLTKAGWAKLLEGAGFSIVEAEVLPYKPPDQYDTDREPHYYITCKKN
ncbi:hypothetical protein PRZ48_000043 [Zasmidium cellare]|uniref:Methyltransferase domain-containing protein n=1 Tax=Zasmidium cellare TaxID=395010 RepID=A0ABR0EYN6_ZASCE|nr:hypothetical protein PRZ48_000043 [Zasmidium cellare]